ncbi:unnamed protein product, partial [Brenthis ino]
MWRKIQEPNSMSEPIQLRNLKQLLHKNRCKCRICVQYQSFTFLNEDKELQVKDEDSPNTFSTAKSGLKLRGIRSINALNSIHSCKDIMCPGCFMAINLLHQKYLKDETSETNPYMFNCDKSTDKVIFHLEKSTSATNKVLPVFKKINSVNDEHSIDDARSSETRNDKLKKEKVTFIEHQEHPQPQSISGDCLCIEHFINSIRPPFINLDM